MNPNHVYDMIIVGGGPGGYTSALYAARAGLDTVVLEKLSAGGQMALSQQIDNYPGFEDGIDGFTLGEKMQQQAEKFGATPLAFMKLRHLSRKDGRHRDRRDTPGARNPRSAGPGWPWGRLLCGL